MENMGLIQEENKNMSLNNIDKDGFWKDKKVLVTGHTGFKGSWLSLWLNKLGAQVMGYALEPSTDLSLFNQIKLSEKCINNFNDIRDKQTLEKTIYEFCPDFVFHLAAQPLVGISYENPELTWSTNVMGTIFLLESLKKLNNKCVSIIITTDKVYKNKEWDYAYRENDTLGGNDPYSSSKAAVEIAVRSWRKSFCGELKHQKKYLKLATARAGNVIGGGDWVKSRLIPDLIDSLKNGEKVFLRNPYSTRPWQHVLEPLSGYLKLAKLLFIQDRDKELESSYNFGPNYESNKSVLFLIKKCLTYWDGDFEILDNTNFPHEAGLLNVSIEKSYQKLKWSPTWDFERTIRKTIFWYKQVILEKSDPLDCCLNDLKSYENDII